MIFKRNISRNDYLINKFENAFHKTGFIDEKLVRTPDKDFWLAFKDLLSDENISSIFSSVLIAYREIPYSASEMQRVLFSSNNEKVYDKIYAAINPLYCRLIECAFIKSPLMWGANKKGALIANTLKILDKEYRDFKIIPKVRTFLEEQLKYALFDTKEDPDASLFLKSTVTLVVPIMEDGGFYNINGMLSYPLYSEKYHYCRSTFDQIKFTFKVWHNKSAQYIKDTGFFDKGLYYDPEDEKNSNKEIFYVKFFNTFYNPFEFFERYQIDELMAELKSNSEIKRDIIDILENTYDIYLHNFKKIKESMKNNIPEITIIKDGDRYYDQFKVSDDSIIVGDDEEEDDDSTAEVVENIDESNSEDQPNSRFSISRKTLSMKMLKSLIMGYNDRLYLSVYPHLSDILLNLTDLNKKPSRKKDNKVIRANEAPQSLQLVITMKSNSDLFTFNDSPNWLDFMYITAYKKYIQPNRTKLSNGTVKNNVRLDDRFIPEDKFGIIEMYTVKSPETAGLVACINPMTCYRKYYDMTLLDEERK